jgi:hypothetical protein
MASMTDPTDALVSFQQALLDGEIRLQRAELDPDLFVFSDKPGPGLVRLTYVRLDGKTVKAFVNAMPAGFIEGLPCFQLGVAVPLKYRSNGYAKSTLAAAIAEMENGFSRTGIIPSFYVEGIVGIDNEPSKRASAAAISATPAITDKVSGLPALQYLQKN